MSAKDLVMGFFGDVVAQHAYLDDVPLPQRRAWVFDGGTFDVQDDPDQAALVITSLVDASLRAVAVDLADAADTITIGQGRRRAQRTLTANRTHTVGVTGAKHGDVLCVQQFAVNAFHATFNNGGPSAGNLVTLPSNAYAFAWFQCIEAPAETLNWVLYMAVQYGNATTTSPGLMSAADKEKLEGLGGLVTGDDLPNGTSTITLASGDRRFLRAETLTGDSTGILSTSGAAEGKEIWIIREDTADFTYQVQSSTHAPLLDLPAGVKSWAVFDFHSGEWQLRVSALTADTPGGSSADLSQTWQDVAYAASIDIDWTLGYNVRVTVSGVVTFINPTTPPPDGAIVRIRTIQAGGHALTFDYKFAQGNAGTPNSFEFDTFTDNATSTYTFIYQSDIDFYDCQSVAVVEH